MNEQITPLQFKVVRDFVADDVLCPEPRVNRFRVVVSYAILGTLAILLAYLSGMLTALADETEIGRKLSVAAVALAGFAVQTIAGICWLAHRLETK